MSITTFSNLIIARYKEGYGVKIISQYTERRLMPMHEHIIEFNEHIIAVQVTSSFRRIKQRLLKHAKALLK